MCFAYTKYVRSLRPQLTRMEIKTADDLFCLFNSSLIQNNKHQRRPTDCAPVKKPPWCMGISLCFVNQGSKVRFPASPSLSDKTLRCGSSETL